MCISSIILTMNLSICKNIHTSISCIKHQSLIELALFEHLFEMALKEHLLHSINMIKKALEINKFITVPIIKGKFPIQ